MRWVGGAFVLGEFVGLGGEYGDGKENQRRSGQFF